MPTFDQFVAALRDPTLRGQIGLVIDDADAATLLSRQDWANDYYTKWLSLFPAAAAAAAASPASVPPSVPVSAGVFDSPTTAPDYGPPPVVWATPEAASRTPSAAKVALIVVGSVVAACVLVAVGVGALRQFVLTDAGTTPATRSTTSAASPSATADAISFHGLTGTEYAVFEAVLIPQGHSLEEAVENGATDAQLRSTFDKLSVGFTTACAQSKSVPSGFENASFRHSFIAGYESTQKVTDEQAGAVYDALGDYCAVR